MSIEEKAKMLTAIYIERIKAGMIFGPEFAAIQSELFRLLDIAIPAVGKLSEYRIPDHDTVTLS